MLIHRNSNVDAPKAKGKTQTFILQIAKIADTNSNDEVLTDKKVTILLPSREVHADMQLKRNSILTNAYILL